MTTNTVLITGANRGIGLGLAQAYCQAGWRVLAVCRSPEQATQLQTLKSQGKLQIFKCEMGNEEEIRALGKELANEAIDLLFNNAAILRDSKDGRPSLKTSDLSFAPLMESFQVNVAGPLILTQALLQPLLRSKLKTIVNLNSTLGSIGINHESYFYNYRASKSAFNAITRNMALELKDEGVTVISLSPGWVKTEMGGPMAEISVEESITAIQKLISKLNLKDSGKFLTHQGNELPW